MKGGYQIIDLQNVSLSDTAVTIAGVHYSIESTQKAILLTNVLIGTTKMRDCFPLISLTDGTYSISVPGYTITINDSDEVTATAV